MYVSLIENAALLVALSGLYSLLIRLWRKGEVWRQLVSGLLFGMVAVVGMMVPFRFQPGIIYDGRSIVLVMAGLFGGGTSSIVSIVGAGAYRAYLGGPGVWAGLGSIVGPAMVGLAFRRACGNQPEKLGILSLSGLGIAAHVVMLACQLLVLPWPAGISIIDRIWLPVMLVFPAATVLMSIFLGAEERRIHAEHALRMLALRNEALLGSIPDIVMEVDIGKIYRWANPAGIQFFGEEVIGRSVDFYFLGEQDTFARVQPLFLGNENTMYVESWQRRRDGETRLLAWWCRVLKDSNGVVTGALSTARDITERRRGEEGIQALLNSIEKEKTTLSALINSITDEVWFADTQGRFTLANLSALKEFNLAPDAAVDVGQLAKSLEVLRPDGSLRPVEEAPPLRALRGEVVANEEEIVRTPVNGQLRYRQVNAAPVRDTEGSIIGAVAVVKDITESKHAEEVLRENQRQLTSIYNTVGDIIFYLAVEPEGQFRFVSVNPTFLRVTGLSQEMVVGRMVNEIVPEPSLTMVLGKYRKAIAEKAIVSWEETSEYPTGRLIGEIRIAPVVNDKGMCTHLVGSVHDITERKRGDEERERLMAAIEQTREMVMITDPDMIIQYVNPAFETVTGYSSQEAVGQHPRLLDSGEHDHGFFQNLRQTLSSGKSWQGTVVNRRKNGALYTEEATVSPVHDVGGRIVNYVMVGRDITVQRQMEAQLRQAQKMETVGQLAGGVAHDFNNMLQVIISYVEMAQSTVEAGQPLHNYLQEVRMAAQRSAELTGQLLAFARKQTVSPKVLGLNTAVAGTQKMIQRLIGEDIALVWTPGRDLWKVRIDPAQLDQVLANLAVNARDAIGGVGRLTVETKNITLDEEYCATRAGLRLGEYVQLAMSDDGCGMNAETVSHMFEPFFTTKGVGKGTGLGLATVYGIVKQNDGYIDVDSEPGQGTTFRVYLPRVEEMEAVGGVKAEAAAPRGGTETVLVVEDEAAILELSRESLEQLGYTVLTANSPEEALKKAGEHAGPLHLVITDVVMPQMNGQQLAERLVTARPGLKCLYMSGYTADVIAHRGVLGKGVTFIAKPFSLVTLAAKVREVLEG